VPVENERGGREARDAGWGAVAQVIFEEGLNARVGGAEIFSEQAFLLVVVAEQGLGDLQERRFSGTRAGRLSERR